MPNDDMSGSEDGQLRSPVGDDHMLRRSLKTYTPTHRNQTMDPSRHHDFLANPDERSNRSTYYGREIPEITSHHYYGPATTTTRTVSSNSTRKPCGCTTTGSGSTAGSITCNGCRLNPPDEGGGGGGGWSTTMATNNQTEHMHRGAAVGAGPGAGGMGSMAGDYHHRMATETAMRSNIRQSPIYAPPPHHQQQAQHPQQNIHPAGMLPTQQHPGHVGNMTGVRTSYWGHTNTTNSSSTTQPYGSVGDEHLDISVTRRNATVPAPPPPHHDYGPPYKTMSMPTNATHSSQHSSSYPLPTSSLHSSNPLHQRVSAIAGGVGGGMASAAAVSSNQANTPYKEQRIYDYQKYSIPSTAAAATSKMPYNQAPTSANMYEGHHLSSQAMTKGLPIDHHVINPSNMPTSKEQHPSPNYARKCPQMYAPEEQTTAHQHLYMSTPQFSSDKFTRASPHQAPPPPLPAPTVTSDYSKLRESPSGSSYLHSSSDKYLQHSTHLRESPQFSTHSSTQPTNRNPTAYYGLQQPQNPSKILPPEMSSSSSSAIIMKQQSHQHANTATHQHYQYSKSPLPPPLPPSHMQTTPQSLPTHNSQQMAAQKQTLVNVAGPPPGSLHSQRYLMDSVKREELEIYEASNPSSARHGSTNASAGIYINPYNTPPPTVADNCCKEVALSNSSSPYTTGSATPNYRVESPQFYPTKYAKLSMNENLNSSKHSLLNQNTPPPSRAPSQRGLQHQANYYYEGNSHSAPSPAAATAASPSPSALLTTTSQTPMHHTEYMSSNMPSGPPPVNSSSQLVAANMPPSYASQPSLTAQHHQHLTQQQPHPQHHLQHPPSSAALRHNDLMITVQPSTTHPYERAILHPNQPSSAAPSTLAPQHLNSKTSLIHPSANSSSSLALQMPPVGSATTAKPLAKHQKPNYRELINQKLALRNATSEEELNMQIIKKTLNVDTQNIRAVPANPLTVSNRAPTARDSSLKASKPLNSVMVTHSALPSTARVIDLPEALPARICIKQEEEKPSSSSGGGGGGSTTASSPLDLSMRTVKTKADSTEYKYQQRPSARVTQNASSTTSSSSPAEGRYTLPRVDSTPIFSVHAFEPAATNRQSHSRHNSLERRNYTPPTAAQQQVTQSPSLTAGSPYPPASTQHIPTAPSSSTHHPYANRETGNSGLTRRMDMPPQSSASLNCYENSLVIKTAPKINNLNSDLVVRPSTITAASTAAVQSSSTSAQPSRPSVLETNPYATVIKTENKRYNETPPISTQHTLAAVERLPPDTSIMALPARNPYGVVRTAIQTNHNNNISSSNPTPPSAVSNYSLACEKNPNFLGRKRHLQEYSQQMSLNEPEAKHKRYMETSTKSPIAMRPADISVIAVNEVKQEEREKSRTLLSEEVHSSVIASTTNNHIINSSQNSKVIVNNVNVTNPGNTSSVLVVCKQEPLTPTGDLNNSCLTASSCIKTTEMPANSFTARIRTKAELKGFTFNPPTPAPAMQNKDICETNKTSNVPAVQLKIKQEEEEEEQEEEEEELKKEQKLIPAEKIKEELVSKIELPTIPGLNDEFEEKSLLDFGWSNTCNNFMEQLLTRPLGKKKVTTIKNLKETDMLVTSSEVVTTTSSNKLEITENNNFSTMESADNTTRSSFTRLEAQGVDSSMTFNNNQQDSINSQSSQFNHKKLSKTEREKKRYQQEKRLAERLKAKESSSESEDELDKRKTERLKKPPMKTKHKMKSNKTPGTNSNSSDKNRFSDCGSDSSSTEMLEDKQNTKQKSADKIEIKEELKEMAEQNEKQDNINKNNNEKCDIKLEKDKEEKEEIEEENKKKEEIKKLNKEEKPLIKKENVVSNNKDLELNKTKRKEKSAAETTENEEDDEEQDEEEDDEEQEEDQEMQKNKQNSTQKDKINKQALNTMTRSKRKQELEQQLANSKVLRNDKIIRNFSNANSSSKIKRKYNRKYNTVNSLLESGGLSRESGIMKSTRLKAKLERNGGKLNIIKNNKAKNNNKLSNNNSKDLGNNNKLKNAKPENVHDRNVIDLYRFKRALKVPPSLINIKHPGAHKIAASLPDLERHAEALEAYAKKRKKNSLEKQTKFKNSQSLGNKIKTETHDTANNANDMEEPKSIIDLLHSRVTKASGMNVRNKTTTTTAVYRPTKPCCTTSSNNTKSQLNNSSNNCGMFSETSQTTESSELQMLPELKKDSDIEEDNDDNDSTNGGKKRHFSIFDTKVLPTKTRTESKLQQKKENIREIFVGDDRPASAPPEMTQTLDSCEKMTYEQKYEQFLQQMNIVVSADTLGRLGRSAAAKKLPSTANGSQELSSLNIKQEENDTESTVMDGDDLKEDHKSVPNHFRKRRGKYLRRKGSSGFDYIRKKKKPTPASSTSNQNNTQQQQHHNGPLSNLHHYSIKSEKYDMDEYENKIKTEDDVSREIQKWVLNKGVGQSTMHKAARQGYIDVIVYCLDRMGMNPDQKDNAGYTPLHEACTNGWLNIARVLLQYGANHSEAAHSGIRPLHEASENDHEEIVRLLLSYGADPLLATYSGGPKSVYMSNDRCARWPRRYLLKQNLIYLKSKIKKKKTNNKLYNLIKKTNKTIINIKMNV
ncbi:BCL-6 corepressor [Lucilia cuprina]|nr:BCL-6 corepressor [Lucilia cuprina]